MNQHPLPTPKQAEWADLEIGVIIHHCMETYHPDLPIKEWKCSPDKMPADSFVPTDENTDQWLEAAAAAGAKYAVFVANHVTGFSMWPTRENRYSIESSPYKNGKADIVADFIRSCKKYGILPGLYYSTGCNGYYGVSDDEVSDHRSPEYQKYVGIVERQLGELWGNYGELFELWFDGGVLPHELGGPDVAGLIRRLQPSAICFQGPKEHFQNLRWVGNERGMAPLDCWSTSHTNTCGFGGTQEDEAVGVGSPDGEYWIPAETDVGNRRQEAFGGGWGWAAGEEALVYPPEELFDRYLTSVGRNSNLLLGMCISQRGHFEDAEQFCRFGELVRRMYSDPAASCSGTGTEFELKLKAPEKIEWLVLMEDIRCGERVRHFTVEVHTSGGTKQLASARCIGHKRIFPVHEVIDGARLVISESCGTPVLRGMTLYR